MRLRQTFTFRVCKSFFFNASFISEGYVKGKPYYPLYAKRDLLSKSYIEVIGKNLHALHSSLLLRRLVTRPPDSFQSPRGETA
jgi:hypothetical protein